MTKFDLCKLLSLGVMISAVGCSSKSSSDSRGLTRNVSATEGTTVTEVMALVATKGAQTKTYSAAVDAKGSFQLQLPKGQRYVLQVMAGDKAVGNIRFAASAGGKPTSFLAVADAPDAANGDTDDGAVDDVDDGAADDIDLGDVEEVAKGIFEPKANPLAAVDSDADGVGRSCRRGRRQRRRDRRRRR